MSHFNIQINIQRVEDVSVLQKRQYGQHGGAVEQERSDRRITEVLKLAVTASSEGEAYRKAHRMLEANAPEPSGEQTLGDPVTQRPR